MTATHWDVIVIGAGIGGLTVGALLAKRGLRVCILEQHDKPGGFCMSWKRFVHRRGRSIRFVFDAGVHDVFGIAPHRSIGRLQKDLGIEGRIDWRRVSHEFIVGDIRLRIPPDFPDYMRLLQDTFPDERDGIARFFTESEALYHEIYGLGGSTMEHVWRWTNTPYCEMIETFVHDARLKQFLMALTGYVTDDSMTLLTSSYVPCFLIDGSFYPAGGSQVFPDELVAVIEAHGGSVRLSTAVSRILIARNQAMGVEFSDGSRMSAPVVVSNADVRSTFGKLIASDALPPLWAKRVPTLRPSCSVFMVFLGVDFMPDAAAFIALPEHSIGIAIPSAIDESLAPPGHASITLMQLVPHKSAVTWKRSAADYELRKREKGDELIALGETVLPGLRDHIIYRQEATPATVERYVWTTNGSIYHLPLDEWHPPVTTPVCGLYLSGAMTSPRPGIEDVVRSGMFCAEAILAGKGAACRAQQNPGN